MSKITTKNKKDSKGSRTNNPIICVDFDGVIHSYTSGWQGVAVIPDPPVQGAIRWLEKHLPLPEQLGVEGEYKGPVVQIYSSRSKSWFGRRAMKRWLVKHGLHPAYIRDGILKFPVKKPAAFLTLDDRAICFDGRFPETEEILAFKPWNKRPLGATGQFPDGKHSHEDEGELRLGVAHDRDLVHVNFGKAVVSLGMSPEEARRFAMLVMKHAAECAHGVL